MGFPKLSTGGLISFFSILPMIFSELSQKVCSYQVRQSVLARVHLLSWFTDIRHCHHLRSLMVLGFDEEGKTHTKATGQSSTASPETGKSGHTVSHFLKISKGQFKWITYAYIEQQPAKFLHLKTIIVRFLINN
jgi:hypothetical protein